MVTAHGSVSVGPEVSASQCLTSSTAKEGRGQLNPWNPGEGRPGLGALWARQEGAACWLGCKAGEAEAGSEPLT